MGAVLMPSLLKWIITASFIAMAIWILIPEKPVIQETPALKKSGAFISALINFFLAEIGDKTQIATAALAVHFGHPFLIMTGSTIGMLAANIPVIVCGHCGGDKISFSPLTRFIAATILLIEAIFTLANHGPI